MVSANAGTAPPHVNRRTAAAAPVTTFTPYIPVIPFILIRPERVTVSAIPLGFATPSPQHIRCASPEEPPGGQMPPKLWMCSIRATLLIQNDILTDLWPRWLRTRTPGPAGTRVKSG